MVCPSSSLSLTFLLHLGNESIHSPGARPRLPHGHCPCSGHRWSLKDSPSPTVWPLISAPYTLLVKPTRDPLLLFHCLHCRKGKFVQDPPLSGLLLPSSLPHPHPVGSVAVKCAHFPSTTNMAERVLCLSLCLPGKCDSAFKRQLQRHLLQEALPDSHAPC